VALWQFSHFSGAGPPDPPGRGPRTSCILPSLRHSVTPSLRLPWPKPSSIPPSSAASPRIQELGQSWRDQEHTKFAEEFEQTTRVMARFADATDRHIPFLMRKAEKIEEYLQQR
jgi:hypothetical protein